MIDATQMEGSKRVARLAILVFVVAIWFVAGYAIGLRRGGAQRQVMVSPANRIETRLVRVERVLAGVALQVDAIHARQTPPPPKVIEYERSMEE